MNCDKASAWMHDFLEDMLDEPQREEIRAHLAGCASCHELSQSLGGFSTDLKLLNHWNVDFDLEQAVRTEINLYGKKKHLGISRRVKLLACAGLLAAGVLFTWNGYFRLLSHYPKSQANLAAVSAEPPALSQLRAIASAMGVKEPSGNSTPSIVAPFAGRQVSLKPFHGHLLFTTADQRDFFMQDLGEMSPDVSFQSSQFLVMNLTYQKLVRLMDIIVKDHVETEGFGKQKNIPEFNATVRISLSLQWQASGGASQAFFQHWHLKFSIPNQYQLLDQLKQLDGARLLYETPELWIFEVKRPHFEKIQSVVKGFQGIQSSSGLDVPAPPLKDEPVRIAVYIEGA